MISHPLETRDKILEVARVMFAEQGFDGTSVRDIAKKAGVNIASVNYHFVSKDNLINEILVKGRSKCAQGIKDLVTHHNYNLDNLMVHVFRYFLEQSPDLISSFKMMMSVKNPNKLISHGHEEESYGPPGGDLIADAIVKEVGKELNKEDLFWAVKTLLGQVVHQTIISSCCFSKNNSPYSSSNDIEKGIRRLTKIVVRELKEI